MARARSQDTEAKPRSDAYVGMLGLSLVAQIFGAVFFYMDWSQYPTTKPPEPPKVTAPAAGAGPAGGVAPAPAPGVPGQQPPQGGAPK
jgi:hypothetical protein